MGKVVNIRRPMIEAAAHVLQSEFVAHAQCVRAVRALGDLSVPEWRRAAVIAGHRLGEGVTTRVTTDGTKVIAALTGPLVGVC